MKHMMNLAWAPILVVAFIGGYYGVSRNSSIVAQTGAALLAVPAADQSGDPNRVNGVHQPPEYKSTVPAPQLPHGRRTMWPNQPNQATHWSIADIRKAHRTLAAAELAGKTIDPNSTLHDFPYWTRTQSMFIHHVAQKAAGLTAQQHLGYAQFIVIMGGTGTAIANGQLVRPETLTEGGRQMFGELRASAITGGDTFRLKEQDWLSIPPNTPVQFRADSPGGLTYMTMKVNAGLYPWELIR